MSRRPPYRLAGPPCPADAIHGPALLLPSGSYHCPHFGHVKPCEHSQSVFTDDEIRAAQDRALAEGMR
jgi:hypothetical protein